MEARSRTPPSSRNYRINELLHHCWKQYDADFANLLSALAFRHKTASYFMNSPKA